MNLADLRARVRYLSKVASPVTLPDAELDRFINEAYQEVCRAEDWPFLRAEAALQLLKDTTGYVLAPAVRQVVTITAVVGESGDTLNAVSAAGYDQLRAETPLAVGLPNVYHYNIHTRQLSVFPTPERDIAARVLYNIRVAPLVLPTDVPVFVQEYHDAIAYQAAVFVLMREEDQSEAARSFSTRYQALIGDMRRDLKVRRDRGRVVVAGRRSRLGRLNPRRSL